MFSRWRLIDKYISFLEDKNFQYIPSIRVYFFHAFMVFVMFFSSIWLGRLLSNSTNIAGTILISLLCCSLALTSWSKKIWGARSSTWWLAGPGLLVCIWAVSGVVLGVRLDSTENGISIGWQPSYILYKSLWGGYIVAWGYARTLVIELF